MFDGVAISVLKGRAASESHTRGGFVRVHLEALHGSSRGGEGFTATIDP